MKVVQNAILNGKKPKIALHAIEDNLNKEYGKITQYTRFPGTFFFSEYIDVARMNFNHFQDEAKDAYWIGHQESIKMAMAASTLEGPEKYLLLIRALQKELFACHFLTDIFASGHIRTPRKALYEYVLNQSNLIGNWSKTGLAGLLAKEMHDEDGNGVKVTNKAREEENKEGWDMYGDECYLEEENSDNRAIILLVVQHVLKDIYNAFSGKLTVEMEEAKAYQKLLPIPLPDDSQLINPLFKKEGNEVLLRADLNDVKCSNYTSNWRPSGAFF